MELPIKIRDFRADEKIHLKKVPTQIDPLYESDKHYAKLLEQFTSELSVRQEVLYAQSRWAVLVIFQGMDTAGKDGAISHVMSGVNPQGCVVTSFKEPSSGELHHDFMWRSQLHLPRRGTIGIFNRSYYEDVLAPRVHRQVFDQQLLPEELAKPDDSFWKHRLKDIAHFESYLGRNGTRVVKFFLHLSKKEQARRLRDRLLADDKHWKVSQSDFRERGYWSEFQDAYQDCLRRSSTRECPWYVIPADDKKNARLIISHILVELMTEMPLRYPKPTADQERFIEEMTREMKG